MFPVLASLSPCLVHTIPSKAFPCNPLTNYSKVPAYLHTYFTGPLEAQAQTSAEFFYNLYCGPLAPPHVFWTSSAHICNQRPTRLYPNRITWVSLYRPWAGHPSRGMAVTRFCGFNSCHRVKDFSDKMPLKIRIKICK